MKKLLYMRCLYSNHLGAKGQFCLSGQAEEVNLFVNLGFVPKPTSFT